MATLLFAHVHKTGGISITQSIASLFEPPKILNHVGFTVPSNLGSFDFVATHAPFQSLMEATGDKIYMTILRNPVSRLVSLFRFWNSISLEHALAIGDARVLRIKRLNFDEFLTNPPDNLLPYIDNEMTRHFSSANSQVTESDLTEAKKNLSLFSEIFIQEELDDDLDRFFRKINCSGRLRLNRLNVTDENFKTDAKVFLAAQPVNLASLSEEASDALLRYTKYDQMLYETAIQLREVRKYETDARLSELSIIRATIYKGETIQPSGSAEFAKMLMQGWANFDVALWSVGRHSSLRFQVAGTGSKQTRVTVGFAGPLVPGRDYFAVHVSCNGHARKKIVFINNDIFVGNIGELLTGECLLCIGSATAEVEFGHQVLRPDGQENIITFETSGGSSPEILGLNSDQRELGVRLCSIKVS